MKVRELFLEIAYRYLFSVAISFHFTIMLFILLQSYIVNFVSVFTSVVCFLSITVALGVYRHFARISAYCSIECGFIMFP